MLRKYINKRLGELKQEMKDCPDVSNSILTIAGQMNELDGILKVMDSEPNVDDITSLIKKVEDAGYIVKKDPKYSDFYPAVHL